jgi:magnesium-transporting ATPase (P-type)
MSGLRSYRVHAMEPLTRTAIVIGSFVVSCLAAAIAFVLCFQTPTVLAGLQSPDVETLDLLRGFTWVTITVWPVVMAIAILPVGLAIAYAESTARRSIWYFLAVWVVIALVPTMPTVVADTARKGQYLVAALTLAVLLVAGLAGGLVYWALAGRNSGNWRRRGSSQEAPPSA